MFMGEGDIMWDRSVIYLVIDFGCDKECNVSGQDLVMMDVSIGYYFNNGMVVIFLFICGGVYGSVDFNIFYISGFNFMMGQVDLNKVMCLYYIYSVIC